VTEEIATTILHSEFGGEDCCGCLTGRPAGDFAEVICSECGEVIVYVPSETLRQALTDMESRLDLATGRCSHCGAVNLFPGFSRVEAFVCQTCGKGNR
jgi:hypothetical protein